MALLSVGAPELAFEGDAAFARAILASYAPQGEHQANERARMLAFLDEYPTDAHLRTRLEGHLTASALLVDAAGERALLTHHRKLGRWLQLGGHCDGDANLPAVALRECVEESGIEALAVDPRPIDLDIHTIPARPGEPEHLHLDTRFLVRADGDAQPVCSHESIELGWFGPHELDTIEVDSSVRRLFELVFGK